MWEILRVWQPVIIPRIPFHSPIFTAGNISWFSHLLVFSSFLIFLSFQESFIYGFTNSGSCSTSLLASILLWSSGPDIREISKRYSIKNPWRLSQRRKNKISLMGFPSHQSRNTARRRNKRFVQRLTFPFPFVHHQTHDWLLSVLECATASYNHEEIQKKVEQLLTVETRTRSWHWF